MPKQVLAIFAAALSILVSACAETPAATPHADAVAGQSILTGSNPANGSSVAGPVDQLELWFNPPARLGEVTVAGPNGMMPMMVTAVGEVRHYSLPLSGLGHGSYTVDWKATATGAEYRGTFGFNVR